MDTEVHPTHNVQVGGILHGVWVKPYTHCLYCMKPTGMLYPCKGHGTTISFCMQGINVVNMHNFAFVVELTCCSIGTGWYDHGLLSFFFLFLHKEHSRGNLINFPEH